MQSTKTDSYAVIEFPVAAAPSAESQGVPGYANVRFNALKHGVLSRYTVLAHESGEEYMGLLADLVAEHQPTGATETHLVEELAGAIWRKRRVLQAEGASINRGLLAVAKAKRDPAINPDGPARAALPFEPSMAGTRLNTPVELAEAIREVPAETARRVDEAEVDLAAAERASEILRRGGVRAYARALRALTPCGTDWWNECLTDDGVVATPKDLYKFIAGELLPYCRRQVVEARGHDAIKAQTLGEGLRADRLEKLNRYETHLDRKFERALAMLLKLKELRLRP